VRAVAGGEPVASFYGAGRRVCRDSRSYELFHLGVGDSSRPFRAEQSPKRSLAWG